jgi:glycosyltransferase involved in cell wall biosynthesis
MKVSSLLLFSVAFSFIGVENRYKKEKISESQKQIIIKKFNLPERFFLYVGDVTWNKNLPKLVAAVKEVNIPIVMVGKALVSDFDRTNPWNRDRIIVMQESDSDLFIKPGFVTEEELVMLYNMTIAVCMPSIDEGFGLPVLEGMSCGAPVIVSRGGSLPEVAGEAGLYIDQDDYHDIGLKMKEISSNNNIWEKYSSKSQEQAKLFSIEKMIKETVKCYENI